MTQILRRFFKNGDADASSPAMRAEIGKLSGSVGIVCNIVLSVAKIIVGLLSGSVAVVADSMNNLTDASSSLVTLWGFRMARRPADKDHPYGHARYEYIAGLAVSFIILIIGVEMLKTSVHRIFSPSESVFTDVVYAVLSVSAVVKIFLSAFFLRAGRLIDSNVVRAAGVDSRNDVFATLAVIVCGALRHFFGVDIDGYVGTAIACFIIYSGVATAKETISPLLGKRVGASFAAKIEEIIVSNEAVLGVHDLLIHDYGPGRYFASVHAEFSANTGLVSCHEIVDSIERLVHDKTGVHLVIHIDPVETDDDERSAMRAELEKIAGSIDARFSLHDFRIVRTTELPKLVFDLDIPYSMRSRRELIKKSIDKALSEKGYEYLTEIKFDSV